MVAKNLIVVRAGDKSFHPNWYDNTERNWDLVVSYYGNDVDRYVGQCDQLHLFKGSKWEGISDYYSKNKHIITKYKYVWFPDDDLFTSQENINNFFDLCDYFNFCIAQPALTYDSYNSNTIVLQNPNLLYRRTNFVEIMAPCFRVKYLKTFAPTFALNKSGWGLEGLWWALSNKIPAAEFAIVDATPVRHTRPVGSAQNGGLEVDPFVERKDLEIKYSLQNYHAQVIQKLSYNALKKYRRWW